ncbi:dUTP pyrophosphatase [Lachnospiraceae bacterium NK3A20]|jgi:dUTP pyrophosphatase|nr:dUTP pyrophosphatase [Lachnospiraceae bacterium NK3A20]
MRINVKKLTPTAKLPMRGSDSAAGYDLYADVQETVHIAPHTTAMIPTGLSMEIPEGYFGAIFARSGLAMKEQLRPGNCVGVVDSDYRGMWQIGLHNDADTERSITPGERIAQMVVIPYLPVEFNETNELSRTQRGEGGFGSTGKN